MTTSIVHPLLFALLFVAPSVLGESWIDAHEATFVAQFRMTMSRTCSPPVSNLKASCSDGIIEFLNTSHSSIQCIPGSSNSEMECSIQCGDNCEGVFTNGSIGSVYFKCAAPVGSDVNALILYDDQLEGSCQADLFHDSKAEKVAQLGMVCENENGERAPYFGHTIFECGRQNDAVYLSNEEYGCTEKIGCANEACDLSFPPISITSTWNNNLNLDCSSPTSIQVNDDFGIDNEKVLEDSDSMYALHTATYHATWSLYKQSSTICEGVLPSSVTISCHAGGTFQALQINNSIRCKAQGIDSFSCEGEVARDEVAVLYQCSGEVAEKALTTIHYAEADQNCDNTVYHSIQMAAFCDGKFSYEDFYWECTEGDITVDKNSRITCFESIPCTDNTDCIGTIPPVTMTSSSNVNDCMMRILSTSVPSSSPSHVPTSAPSGAPSVSPSTAPTASPTGSPSATPSFGPSSAPSSVPSVGPSPSPSNNPTGKPSNAPSSQPSYGPSAVPSKTPSAQPTSTPSSTPTESPSVVPSPVPTGIPSSVPTPSPSQAPSDMPSLLPTGRPSDVPSYVPSSGPSFSPTEIPSHVPSSTPTSVPSGSPSVTPSTSPTAVPTSVPTSSPSQLPSDAPSLVPTTHPSSLPSAAPSGTPSSHPSSAPSGLPSVVPSASPTAVPTSVPTFSPSQLPSDAPSLVPTTQPSSFPSAAPSEIPSSHPSSSPSGSPSSVPTSAPSQIPSDAPSLVPTTFPTGEPTALPADEPTLSSSVGPTKAPAITEQSKATSSQPTSTPALVTPTSSPLSHPALSYPTQLPSRTPTASPTVAFVPSDYPSINPPRWTESVTNLPTGHTLNDDYIPPTTEPATEDSQETKNDSNRTFVIEGISAGPEEDIEKDTNWKRAFTIVTLIMAGVVLAVPVTKYSRRQRG